MMNIADIVTDEFVALEPDTTVSKLVGTFEDPSVRGVVVVGDEYEGVITRRDVATSHLQPQQKLKTIAGNVPRLTPDEEVRTVAKLMIESDALVLPVFDGETLAGVVDVDGILREVEEFLDAATVADAYSSDLITLEPDQTVGRAFNVFREHRITHLPVIEDRKPVGILSLYDVLDVRIREEMRSQGGDPAGRDPYGGEISDASGRARRGGFGAREGELARILDIPVNDFMVTSVRTIGPGATLDVAVREMFEIDASSLVVTENGRPFGIITKTDILDALTWEAEGTRAVQIYGIDLLDDVSHEDIVSMVEKFDDRDHGMALLDAKVHLHEHSETRRGRPLILARIRLFTDQGLYLASGEGFGASQAINEARDALERQIRDKKTYGKSKKPRNEEFWEKRFGWVLEQLD